MSATSTAPVASVFARSAIATFPPASRSPMMPRADDAREQQRRPDGLGREPPREGHADRLTP